MAQVAEDRLEVVTEQDQINREDQPEEPSWSSRLIRRSTDPSQKRFPAQRMEAWPVGSEVGSVKSDRPGLIEPVTPPGVQGGLFSDS